MNSKYKYGALCACLIGTIEDLSIYSIQTSVFHAAHMAHIPFDIQTIGTFAKKIVVLWGSINLQTQFVKYQSQMQKDMNVP